VNMCPSLVKIRSVTSEIRRRKRRKKKEKRRKKKTTAIKYKPFGIAMSCGLIIDIPLLNVERNILQHPCLFVHCDEWMERSSHNAAARESLLLRTAFYKKKQDMKRCYSRGTARLAMSMEILSASAQLYEKSHLKRLAVDALPRVKL